MAKAWRKAVGALLSVVLVTGLLPCAAWGEDVQADEGEGGATETGALQVFGNTVSVGDNHTAVIEEDGSLWTCGNSRSGQLGRTTDDYQNHDFAKIMDGVVAVSLGVDSSAAVKQDGTLWTWGANWGGVLGKGASTTAEYVPAQIMEGVATVSMGGYHAAAIKQDGTLWMWGRNITGELGIGTFSEESITVPTQVEDMDDVIAVSLGFGYSAAIKGDGTLWMWGDNGYGQYGNGEYGSSTTPLRVMDGVSAVSVGNYHTAVIKQDGSLWMWGRNDRGQLGNGTTEDSISPVWVMDDVAAVSLAGDNSAAVKKDGTLWLWGANEYGQIGNELTKDSNVPVQVTDNVAAVSVGFNHIAAIKQDKSLWTWGCNNFGQLGFLTVDYCESHKPSEVMTGVALPNGLAPKPTPSDTIPSSPLTADVTFKVSGGDGHATTSVKWDDAWFNTSSYTYNHDLATTAAVLSAAAYEEGYVQKGLRKGLGFDAYDAVEYHPEGDDYDGDFDQVGYSIETRMTSNGIPIIAVVVRGTPGNGEWLSNLNVDDWFEGSRTLENHEGFEKAASRVAMAFEKYVKDNGIDLDKARVLITGHSRGAAVANILGAWLDDGDFGANGSLAPERIYDFTFESPTSTASDNRDKSVYRNIFNIVNPEDVIVMVPLPKWGYGRYGRDLVLPSRSNTDTATYKALLSSMNEYFGEFSDGETFKGYLAGTLTATAMTADLSSIAPSTRAFYRNYLVGVPPRNFFNSVVKAAMLKNASASDKANLSAALLIPEYRNMLLTLFGTGVLNGAFVTGKGVVHGHTQETYVAWMKSASVGESGKLPSIFTHKNYRTVSVACPVDVRAYDAEGNLVAAIVDDTVDESLLEDGLPAAVTTDGTKMIDLPAGGEYRLEVTATDNGEMDVTVEEKDGASATDEPVSVKSYQGVALQEGESFSLDAQIDGGIADCALVSEATGEEVRADSVVCGDDLEKVDVSVAADGLGDAWGGGTVLKGGKTVIRAMAQDGAEFVGWERETGSRDDGTYNREAVEGGADLEVRATEDATYIASFRRTEAASVTRIAGSFAADTSAAVALEAFPEGSEWAVLARDDDFADAMSATGLAGALGAPIVLTDRYGLSDAAREAIGALGIKNVYVIGGKGAMPGNFEGELRAAGVAGTVERVYGNASWDTSVACAEKIAEHGGNAAGDAVVAMSLNFQDALSISSFAYRYGVPIFLETDNENGRCLTDEAESAIAALPGTVYVPGGPGAVPTSTVEGVFPGREVVRLWGNDGYDTSNQIAAWMVENGKLSAQTVCLASGAPDPKGVDALAGAALAGKLGGVMLLANANPRFGDVSTVTIEGADSNGSQAFLSSYAARVGNAYVLGGAAVMPEELKQQVENVLK